MKQRLKLGKLPIKLKDDNKHYSCSKYYSYTDIFMGLIDGGRGIGKTTAFLMKALKNCEKGEEFIYLRRYKPEIKKFVNKDSLAPLLDGVRYQGDGTGGYTAYYENQLLGYFICLSTARSYKSVDFSKVTLLIYDEAFVHNTTAYRYLTDECIQFLEFVSTVVRTRKNIKVVLLGNNEDMFSPYHSYFNVPMFERIYIDADKGLYCEHAKNSEALLKDEQETGLFKLIKDTGYGKYHYDNEIINNGYYNVIKKPSQCRLMFRLIANNHMLNIYNYTEKDGIWLYCEHKEKCINDSITYLLFDNGSPNYFYIDLFKKRLMNYIYRFYFNKRMNYNEERGGAIMTWIIENT